MHSVDARARTYMHEERALQKADLRRSRISLLLQIKASKKEIRCKVEPWGSILELGTYTEWDN